MRGEPHAHMQLWDVTKFRRIRCESSEQESKSLVRFTVLLPHPCCRAILQLSRLSFYRSESVSNSNMADPSLSVRPKSDLDSGVLTLNQGSDSAPDGADRGSGSSARSRMTLKYAETLYRWS